MNFRNFILIVIFFINTNIYAQDKVYYSKTIDKHFKISEKTEVKELKLVDGEIGELFIVYTDTDKKDLKYTVMIIKKKIDLNLNKIKEREEFKNSFFQECNCIFLSETFKRFNSFTSYRLKIKIENLDMYGYSDNFSLKENSYSFTFISNSYNNFEKYSLDYDIFLKLLDETF